MVSQVWFQKGWNGLFMWLTGLFRRTLQVELKPSDTVTDFSVVRKPVFVRSVDAAFISRRVSRTDFHIKVDLILLHQ